MNNFIDIKTVLTPEEFNKRYVPMVNDKKPFPKGVLTDTLGCVFWDRRDYSMLGNYINLKSIWTVIEREDVYMIVAGIYEGLDSAIAFVLGECPYGINEVGRTVLIINKSDDKGTEV